MPLSPPWPPQVQEIKKSLNGITVNIILKKSRDITVKIYNFYYIIYYTEEYYTEYYIILYWRKGEKQDSEKWKPLSPYTLPAGQVM